MVRADVGKVLEGRIKDIAKQIKTKTEEIKSLKGDLKQLQKALAVIGGKQRGRGRAGRMVNWDNVLKKMPTTFTMDDLARTPTGKSRPRPYLNQVVLRWKRKGSIKSAGRGAYAKT